MRFINAALAALMLAFAVMALDDPTQAHWLFIFALTGAWLVIAAAAPSALTIKPVTMLLSLTVAGAILGVIFYWPSSAGWWRTENWGDPAVASTIRMLVVTAALFSPIVTSVRKGNEKRRAAAAAKEAEIEERNRAKLREGASLDY